LEGEINIQNILKSLVGTAGIFTLGMLFSFTFNWIITKYMNQDQVGLFQYYISIITFAMIIVPLGYQGLAQREALALGRNGLKKLSIQAGFAVILSSIVFGSFWYFGLTKYHLVKGLSDFSGFYIAFAIIPVYALNIFFRSILQSQNKIYSSILPDVLLRPIILLCGALFLPALGVKVSNNLLLWILLFFLLGALLFSMVRVFQKTSFKTLPTKNKWLKQALLLLPIGLLATVNERIDVVMVSKVLGMKTNAIYTVAFKFALFSGFGLVILNQVLVPYYAEYFKSNDNPLDLRQKIKPNVRLSFLLSFIVVLFLILIGNTLLSWFGKSGENYTIGYNCMIILSFGQLLNVAFGSTGYILTMAKKESLVLLSIGCGILTNITLNYFLLKDWGIEGAAIATTSSLIVWNTMMLIFVKRKTGINPTIF
jgi:O-antigen/teichoic acid export membrane protein